MGKLTTGTSEISAAPLQVVDDIDKAEFARELKAQPPERPDPRSRVSSLQEIYIGRILGSGRENRAATAREPDRRLPNFFVRINRSDGLSFPQDLPGEKKDLPRFARQVFTLHIPRRGMRHPEASPLQFVVQKNFDWPDFGQSTPR
ncbi:hypothetical protein ORIO_04335 [Cereibacter azotoformans]|uniref:hypothetical protein n=1 Tax=Cereibacter azotoformans TaxID=43057 RepID=UPI0012664969|nr:hypothetical protein [Cereibacter azotoformans]ULB09153.1 hypothetical protein ORIO_04335 [Cereibacter azotoformans]